MDDSEGDSDMTLFLAVFFGWCGLDRILEGAFFTGLLKMSTFGGFGIWWSGSSPAKSKCWGRAIS